MSRRKTIPKRDKGVVYAEDLPYWKSSQTHPDTWNDRTKKLIVKLGGQILAESFSNVGGSMQYMLGFSLGADRFKMTWPVFQSLVGNESAAKIQAATFLYHEVKHRCDLFRAFGARRAFMEYLMLPDGLSISEAVAKRGDRWALTEGVVEGEIIP